MITVPGGNPKDCNDMENLRAWVSHLQEQVELLHDMNTSSMKLVRYGKKIMEAQDKGIALLEEKSKTLTARIAQYEAAFNALIDQDQMQGWMQQGRLLMTRYADRFAINLYAVDNFFVQVCRPAGAV